MYQHIVIIGSSGAIGQALVQSLCEISPDTRIQTVSRHPQAKNANIIHHQLIDYTESSLVMVADQIAKDGLVDGVIVANGLLHAQGISPEKSLKDLSAEQFEAVFSANTIFPALVAKHFCPNFPRDRPTLFAALSARVGSISDNRLGGWYAYRASKAALNMVIKNIAIEMARTHQQATILALHPGTVDSPLSKPFQTRVPEHQLFHPDISAHHLINVMNALTPKDSGKCFAWDAQEIPP